MSATYVRRVNYDTILFKYHAFNKKIFYYPSWYRFWDPHTNNAKNIFKNEDFKLATKIFFWGSKKKLEGGGRR